MFSICVHFSTGMSIRAYMYLEFTLYKRKIEYTINISLGNRLILEEDVEQHRQAESGCDRGRSLGTLLFKGEESFFSLELFKNICTWFDKTLEFIKGRSKRSHLNKIISQKHICWNSEPTVLLCFWKTFYQYYSYKAKAQMYTSLWSLQTLHIVHVGKTKMYNYHFFFVCKKYSKARNNMFNQLFMLDLVNIDTNLLLCGDVHMPLQTNINIFSAVHQFIEESTRFT